ncbi:hypothetical protein ACVWYH_005608 [Bradyrhizobium sp. GM24.11]
MTSPPNSFLALTTMGLVLLCSSLLAFAFTLLVIIP